MKTNSTTTLRLDYGGNVREHILVIRGRPFSCLESPNIPTPNTTFIDFKLVKELNLKVANMTYEKMTLCGTKMRKIGTVAVTAQCLHDGRVLGSIPLKATVVLGLAENFDADAVAGHKLLSVLNSSSSPPSPVPQSPRAPSPHTPPPGRPSPRRSSRGSSTPPVAPTSSSPQSPTPSTPQHVRWARLATPTRSLSPLSAGTSSPPGYPDAIYTPVYDSLHNQPVTLSPYSTNLAAFKQSFHQADQRMEPRDEMLYLQQVVDPAGVADQDVDGMFHFSDYNSTYEAGHGRNKCNPLMCVKPGHPPEAVPVNCGFHQDWLIPRNFKECGQQCKGAYCKCLRQYSINNFCDYYDFDEEGKVLLMKT